MKKIVKQFRSLSLSKKEEKEEEEEDDPNSSESKKKIEFDEGWFSDLPLEVRQSIKDAAVAIQEADFLLISAGAGMGVGSGLGTFRGSGKMVWPPFENGKLNYVDACDPDRFLAEDKYGGPSFGWSFWKNCIDSYSLNSPHIGYHILAKWTERIDEKFLLRELNDPLVHPSKQQQKKQLPCHVFTSNIDGHFLRIPTFKERVYECHGSALYQQCQKVEECSHSDETWPSPLDFIQNMKVDPKTHMISSPLPLCKGNCGLPSRPQVLMFGDLMWDNESSFVQEKCYQDFKSFIHHLSVTNSLKGVAIEIGAGLTIPTVRDAAENFSHNLKCPLIRINPNDCQNPIGRLKKYYPIPLGSLEALIAIDHFLA